MTAAQADDYAFATPSPLLPVGRIVFGLALLAFGAESLMAGDFMASWQPAPKDLPYRRVLAGVNAVLLMAPALLIVAGRFVRPAALAVAALIGVWIVTMHLPKVVAHPAAVGVWLGVAEVSAMAAAAVLLAALSPPAVRAPSRWDAVARRAAEPARIVFGLSLLVFGLSHLVYPVVTAGLIPAWIPGRLGWAYVTGAAHIAAGLAVLSGVLAYAATRALIAMFLGFLLLVHITGVVSTHGSVAQIVFLTVSCILLGSACLLAASTRRRSAKP